MNTNSVAKISAKSVDVFYGDKQALNGINLDMYRNQVTALIGPSGCGKSTFIRCLNRMNDTIENCRVEGVITLDGQDIHAPIMEPVELRARVGMVFQKPNPFPKSVYDNIAYGPRIHGMARTKSDMDGIIEQSLRRAGLWDEVKDRLNESGTGLSGGQQQRLTLAPPSVSCQTGTRSPRRAASVWARGTPPPRQWTSCRPTWALRAPLRRTATTTYMGTLAAATWYTIHTRRNDTSLKAPMTLN